MAGSGHSMAVSFFSFHDTVHGLRDFPFPCSHPLRLTVSSVFRRDFTNSEHPLTLKDYRWALWVWNEDCSIIAQGSPMWKQGGDLGPCGDSLVLITSTCNSESTISQALHGKLSQPFRILSLTESFLRLTQAH